MAERGKERKKVSGGRGCCGPSSCCGNPQGPDPEVIAQAMGYSEKNMAALPEGTNMGLSDSVEARKDPRVS